MTLAAVQPKHAWRLHTASKARSESRAARTEVAPHHLHEEAIDASMPLHGTVGPDTRLQQHSLQVAAATFSLSTKRKHAEVIRTYHTNRILSDGNYHTAFLHSAWHMNQFMNTENRSSKKD